MIRFLAINRSLNLRIFHKLPYLFFLSLSKYFLWKFSLSVLKSSWVFVKIYKYTCTVQVNQPHLNQYPVTCWGKGYHLFHLPLFKRTMVRDYHYLILDNNIVSSLLIRRAFYFHVLNCGNNLTERIAACWWITLCINFLHLLLIKPATVRDIIFFHTLKSKLIMELLLL